MPPRREVMFHSRTSESDWRKARALYETLDEEDKRAVKGKLQVALLNTQRFLVGTAADYLSLNAQLGRLISSVVLPNKRLASGQIVRRDSLNIKALIEHQTIFEDIIPEGFLKTLRDLEQRISLSETDSHSTMTSSGLSGAISDGLHPRDSAGGSFEGRVYRPPFDPFDDDNAPPSLDPPLSLSPGSSDNPSSIRHDSMEAITGPQDDMAREDERISTGDLTLLSNLSRYQRCHWLLSQINECRLIPRILNKSDRLMLDFIQRQKEELRRIEDQEATLLNKVEELESVLKSVSSAEIGIINQCLNPLLENMSTWYSCGNKDKIRRVEEALLNLPLLERGTAFSAHPPTKVKEALLSYRVGLYKGVVPRTADGMLDERRAGKTYRQIVRQIAASKLIDTDEQTITSKRIC